MGRFVGTGRKREYSRELRTSIDMVLFVFLDPDLHGFQRLFSALILA